VANAILLERTTFVYLRKLFLACTSGVSELLQFEFGSLLAAMYAQRGARQRSRNLADVARIQVKVHFKQLLAELATTIAANHEVLKKHQALMEAQLVDPDHDHDEFFDAQDVASTIQRVNRVCCGRNLLHLLNPRITSSLIVSLARRDAKIHIKILQRGAVVGNTCTFGPRCRSTWLNVWIARCAVFNFADWELA